jgi:two-component system sensor histidine kinase ChiS
MEIRVVLANVLVFIIGIILFAQIFISGDLPSTVLRAVIFVFYAYFGYLLIKSVLKEIEQRKQLEELSLRLEKANKRLRELDKLKDEFISVASHDLRAPIAVIEGYLSMVLSEKTGRLPSKARELLEKVYSSTRYLAMLSRDVLETSRINQKRLKLDLTLNDIKEVVSNMVDQFQINAQEKGIYLKAHLPKRNIPKFMFDKQRIEEVLQNLIGNAIKFTDKGGIEVGVEVRPGQKLQPKYKKKVDKEVLVWVKDTGVGIPKDKLSYVFGKFTQVRNDLTRDKRGTGLGLFICKSIIDLHGGKIWVVSEGDGRGSTFFFTLPFLKNE